MNTTTKPKDKAAPVVLPVDLRDYFAAKAMQGRIEAHTFFGSDDDKDSAKRLARVAYIVADAMLSEREKP